MNEHGVITNPIEFYRATNSKTQIVLSVGEHGGLWGYGCQVTAKTSGFYCPCMPMVHQLKTREQAEAAAKKRAGLPTVSQLNLFDYAQQQ